MTPDTATEMTAPADRGPGFDDAAFDALVADLAAWSGSLTEWPPARRVRSAWEQVEPRLDRARRELARVLVVGVIGGTGTGKSTLVNALAGRDVSPAGDVARPTSTNPVVVVARDVDLAWLPVDAMAARVVRSDAPAVANIVLVDCPDPDTQAQAAHARDATDGMPPRPSDANRNRDLLEAVLPACDVLLLVATAQKYRSWVVAREVAAFAPGRPLLFVQTHASRDPDIRDDWRKELESQGFIVPRIFRLDAVEAGRRAAAGLDPEPGFRDLVRAIDDELVGRAARRVRRNGAIDLAGWFLGQARAGLEPLRGPVADLSAGVARERSRLEGVLARAIEPRLRTGRAAWQRALTDEIVDRWHGGPFATFLHAVSAIGTLWPRVRSAGGGLIGRLVAGQPLPEAASGNGAWQAIEDLGIGEGDVEQSRSILVGLAARSRMSEPMVGRARIDPERVGEAVGTLLDRTGGWLAAGIDRLVADRRGRTAGPAFRWFFEGLFSALLVAVLWRAAWNFFHGHLWLGRPMDGGGFLQEALVWVILWGFLLRWIVFARVRAGLDRDVSALVSRLPAAHLVDPLLADFARAAEVAGDFLDRGERLSRDAAGLAAGLEEPGRGGLGRLRGGGA